MFTMFSIITPLVIMFSRLIIRFPFFQVTHMYGYHVLHVNLELFRLLLRLISSPTYSYGFHFFQITHTVTMMFSWLLILLPRFPGYSYGYHVLQVTHTVTMFSRLLLWLSCSPGYSYGYHVFQVTPMVIMFSRLLIRLPLKFILTLWLISYHCKRCRL